MVEPDRSPAAPNAAPAGPTGTRPLVSGAPVVIGLIVIGLAVAAMLFSLGRDPGLPAVMAQHYTAMMAGTVAPDLPQTEPAALADALTRAGVAFRPRIVSLAPDFELLGGRRLDVGDKAGAAWLYRAPSADAALALAFPGQLDDLGAPDSIRQDGTPVLRIFRKTTQTIACWQDGPLVYAFISTLPGETVIRLARRHGAPSAAATP